MANADTLNEKKVVDVGRLSRLGFRKTSDYLMVVPKEYRDYTCPITVFGRSMLGTSKYFILRIHGIALFDANKRPTRIWRDVARVRVDVRDFTGRAATITVFGLVFPWLKLQPGAEVHLYGVLELWNGQLQLNNPSLVDESEQGQVVPIYRGKVGQVSGATVKAGVSMALNLADESACRLLAELGMREQEFAQMTGIHRAADFLTSIHLPQTVDEGVQAVEMAKRFTARAILKRGESNKVKTAVRESVIPVSREYVEYLISLLPYPLTSDQRQAINEIVDDLRSPFAMNRLLSGDVGTGKTLTFLIPAVAAMKAGAKVALIVPSQLLVSQMARDLREFFPGVPVSEVISGGQLGEGIAVGTTALLTISAKKKIEYDFVICDEQHKFSVSQKNALNKKHTNLLEATATAIPRTLAIVSFGGMDLSVLRKCPVNKTIASRIVYGHEKDRLFAFVEKVFSIGSQVAVILPLVEEQDESIVDGRLQSVTEAAAEWGEMFPDRRIDILTGKMTSDEKEAVIARMHSRETNLLISTVVIETGVTLPSLAALIVVNAERFGVSQLHQLRGRVARKGGRGYFFMFCPLEIDDEAHARMELLTRFNDGFAIAEHDMNSRGYGDIDIVSASQTGAGRLLFWGVTLTKEDIDEEARNLNLAVA